jgi:hypothetical protein
MMGVNIPSDDFEHIDLIREIENSRNSLLEKNNKPVSESLVIHHDCGVKSPLHLECMMRRRMIAILQLYGPGNPRKLIGERMLWRLVLLLGAKKKCDTSTLHPGRPVRQKNTPSLLK